MGVLLKPLKESQLIVYSKNNSLDMESAQVSRLLELAAAMSSAQEEATGNGKLDMAGIMAALALAQKEEMTTKTSFQGGGQSSFLHGSYQRETVEKTSSSSLVRAEYVKTTTISEDVQIGGKGNVETEERKRSFLHNNDTVKKNENVKEKESNIGSNLTG